MGECHQEVGEPGWSLLISLAAVVALFVTLMHHWGMMEESRKNRHWSSPIWNAEARLHFYQWAQFKSTEELKDMAETIHRILTAQQGRGVPL